MSPGARCRGTRWQWLCAAALLLSVWRLGLRPSSPLRVEAAIRVRPTSHTAPEDLASAHQAASAQQTSAQQASAQQASAQQASAQQASAQQASAQQASAQSADQAAADSPALASELASLERRLNTSSQARAAILGTSALGLSVYSSEEILRELGSRADLDEAFEESGLGTFTDFACDSRDQNKQVHGCQIKCNAKGCARARLVCDGIPHCVKVQTNREGTWATLKSFQARVLTLPISNLHHLPFQTGHFKLAISNVPSHSSPLSK